MITTDTPPAVGSANSGPSGRAPTSAARRRSPVAPAAEVAEVAAAVAPAVPVALAAPADRMQTRLGADDVDEDVGRVPAATSAPPSFCSWTSSRATGTS